MEGFFNVLREQALRSELPDDTVLVATVQWRPEFPRLEDPASYIPPREYLVTVKELKSLPVTPEPPPPIAHDPLAEKVILTMDKSVRKTPDRNAPLVKTIAKGSEAWVVGVKTPTGYRQLEDKTGWLYVQGIAGQ